MITFQVSGDTPEEIKDFLASIYKPLEEQPKPKAKFQPKEHISNEQKTEIIRLDKAGINLDEIKSLTGIKNYRQILGIIQANKHPIKQIISEKLKLETGAVDNPRNFEETPVIPINNPDDVKANQPVTEECAGSTIESSLGPHGLECAPLASDPFLKPEGTTKAGTVAKLKIPHSQDAFILEQRKAGKQFGEIAMLLTRQGHRCKNTDVSNRFYSLPKDKADKGLISLTEDQKTKIRQWKLVGLRNVAIARRLDVDPKLVDAYMMAEELSQQRADLLAKDPKAYAEFLQDCKTGTPPEDPEDKDDLVQEVNEQ